MRSHFHGQSRPAARRYGDAGGEDSQNTQPKTSALVFDPEVVEGKDYVSDLNILKDKVRGIFEGISYAKPVGQTWRNGGRYVQYWTVSVKIGNKLGKDEEEEHLAACGTGKTRKNAKQAAAKKLMSIINEELDKAKKNGDDINSLKKGAPKPTVSKESSPISALTEWWQKGLLTEAPSFTWKDTDGADDDGRRQTRYVCVLAVTVKALGKEKMFEATDSVKKGAKGKVAAVAVKYIKELKLTGFEEALKPKKLADPQRALADSLRKAMQNENVADTPCGHIFYEGDDDYLAGEAYARPVFSLPEEFEVRVAKSEEECVQWISTKLNGVSEIGVYFDAVRAREEMRSIAEKAGFRLEKCEPEKFVCELICLATNTSALVVHTARFKYVLPSAIANLFKNKYVEKITACSSSLLIGLCYTFDVTAANVVDLATCSYSLTGRIEGTREIIPTLQTMTRSWLKKVMEPFSFGETAAEGTLEHSKQKDEGFEAFAVQSAFVVLQIMKKCESMAAVKTGEVSCAGTDLEARIFKIKKRRRIMTF